MLILFKKAKVSFKTVMTAALWSMCALRLAAQIPDVPGWQLYWHDEFDGNSLNTTNWTAMNRQDSYNNELQYYWPNQVAVANGNLQITAIKQTRGTKQYQSGLITSNALYGRGRFEARIDLPTTKGMWPAFWLNANQVSWPLGGEIDVMENKGSQPTLVSSAFHWQNTTGPDYVFHNYTATSGGNPLDFTTGFHTYAVEWDNNASSNVNEVRFYVDGNLHFTVDEDARMSDANFTTAKNIILNLAVGGNFDGNPDATTVFPQTMLVDYVRVWHKQTGLAGDYNGDGKVDAADYVIWRKSNGQSAIGLAADGSGNGTVAAEDYDVWRRNVTSASGANAFAMISMAVPEPTAAMSLAIAIMLCHVQRLRTLPTAK